MSALVHSPSAVRPIDLIRQAVAWAQVEGIRVDVRTDDDYGITCVSSLRASRWERKATSLTVCPLGAVVLMRQPDATELPAAAAEALGCSEVYCDGFGDGLARANPNQWWMGTQSRHHYVAGWADGVAMRTIILTRLCVRHNLRVRRGTLCWCCQREIELGTGSAEVE